MMTMTRTILASTALLLLAGGGTLLTGCGGDSAKKPAADPAVVAEAKQVWESRCVTCHGPQGIVPLNFVGQYQQIGDWMGDIPRRLTDTGASTGRRPPSDI